MAESRGIDTATALRGCASRVDLGAHAVALRLHGYDFVMRSYSRDPALNLTRTEAQRLCAAGLRIGTVWDVGPAGSRRQGLLDGAEILRLARTVGQAPGSAVYFAVGDADPDGALAAYLAGVRAALAGPAGYRVGVHGGGASCAALVDRGLAVLSWPREPGAARPCALLGWQPVRITVAGTAMSIAPVLGRAGADSRLFHLSSRPRPDAMAVPRR